MDPRLRGDDGERGMYRGLFAREKHLEICL
jgi:hypothetical protein